MAVDTKLLCLLASINRLVVVQLKFMKKLIYRFKNFTKTFRSYVNVSTYELK